MYCNFACLCFVLRLRANTHFTIRVQFNTTVYHQNEYVNSPDDSRQIGDDDGSSETGGGGSVGLANDLTVGVAGETDQATLLCIVCLERPRNIAWVPCGHVCCCQECSEQMRVLARMRCCVCRANVTETVKLFF
jgi:hypothetical protein